VQRGCGGLSAFTEIHGTSAWASLIFGETLNNLYAMRAGVRPGDQRG
jgi:hypothetical protein